MEPRSFAAVMRDILQNVGDIFRAEVRLAKAELVAEAKTAASSGVWLIAGFVFAVMAAGCLVWSAVYALSLVMALWAATLVVALLLGGASAAMCLTGIRRLRQVDLVPPRTVATLKENVEWIKQ